MRNFSFLKQIFYKNLVNLLKSYERINTEEFSKNSESSSHRIKRIKKLKIPENLEDMLDLASDDFDTEFPIFRTPRKTGIFFIKINCLRISLKAIQFLNR